MDTVGIVIVSVSGTLLAIGFGYFVVACYGDWRERLVDDARRGVPYLKYEVNSLRESQDAYARELAKLKERVASVQSTAVPKKGGKQQ